MFGHISKCIPFSVKSLNYLVGKRIRLTYFYLYVIMGISNLRCLKLNSYYSPTNLLLPQSSSIPSCTGQKSHESPQVLSHTSYNHIDKQILWSYPTKYSQNSTISQHFYCHHHRPSHHLHLSALLY